jgi:hypothetical protein
VTIRNCTLGHSFHGMGVSRSARLNILNNTIGEVRTTPLAGSSLTDCLIQGNKLGPSRPWKWGVTGGKGDHGDFIHIITEAGYGPVSNLRIIGNLIDQGDGEAILGIYLDNGMAGAEGFIGTEIARNTIILANNQAIRVEGGINASIHDNTLYYPGAGPNLPAIILPLVGTTATCTGNITGGGKAFWAAYPLNTLAPVPVSPEMLAAARAKFFNPTISPNAPQPTAALRPKQTL